MRKLTLILVLLLSSSPAFSQYWSDYVLEKGFNPRDYFLRPHRIYSLQTRNFDKGLLGVRPDSVSDISFQPANLSAISGNFLYIDLKGSESISIVPKFVYPLYAYENARFLPPYMGYYAERQLRPMLSAIYVGSLSEKYLPGVKFGFSYELIHHQGKYYDYFPIRYYGAYDAFGSKAEVSRNFPELPIDVKQDGLDEKTETAHFLDTQLSVPVSKKLWFGAKVGRIQGDLTGDYYRLNNYDNEESYEYRSRYLNSRHNTMNLWQNEYSVGLLFRPSHLREIGVFGGLITGNQKQRLSEMDSSFYSWNSQTSDHFSRSNHRHSNQSHWLHEGNTQFLGLHGKLPMEHNITFRFTGEMELSAVDISNGNVVKDTSYYHYRWRDYQTDTLYDYIYKSSLADNRLGDGDETAKRYRAAAGINIPIFKNSLLTIALAARYQTRNVTVYEDAGVLRLRDQVTDTPYRPKEKTVKTEDKTVRLSQKSRSYRIALPVAANFYLGKGFSLYLGAVKQLLHVETEEIVDIWYRVDSLITIRKEETIVEAKQQHIDRYIATPYRSSESSTDFMMGLAFQPSKLALFELAFGSQWLDLKYWQFALKVNL